MRLGFHISIAGGLAKVVPRALRRGCTTLQLFSSSPVQWERPPLDAEECQQFLQQLAAYNIQPHFVHASYLLNVASPNQELRQRSISHLGDELQRAELLNAAGVVLHLGSVGDEGAIEPGIERVAHALDAVRLQAENDIPLILENSAGAGNTLGTSLAEIAQIMAASEYSDHLQFCLDTAHAFAAGWPVHQREGLDQVLAELDNTLGPKRLVLIHANDSRSGWNSRVDRHWHIGRGKIGREGFRIIVNHPRLCKMPFIMETPGTEEDDVRNMRAIRQLVEQDIHPPLGPPAN